MNAISTVQTTYLKCGESMTIKYKSTLYNYDNIIFMSLRENKLKICFSNNTEYINDVNESVIDMILEAIRKSALCKGG